MPRVPDTTPWDTRYAASGALWGHFPALSAEETGWRLRVTGARRVLVSGCAYGRHCAYFARRGLDVTGIDASQAAIDMAHDAAIADRLRISLARASSARMPFSDGAFDAVYDHDLLHHLSAEDRVATVAEYHRVLRPGGLLAVSALATSDPEFGIGPEVEPRTHRGADGRLEHFFTEGELRGLLGAFDVDTVREVAEPAAGDESGEDRRFLFVLAERGKDERGARVRHLRERGGSGEVRTRRPREGAHS